jgi:hypothetical protein
MIHSLIDRLIVLTGLALQPEHCHVTNINGVVAITPLTDARVFINGTLIREATQVKHDDRVSGHLHDTDSVLSLSLSLSLSHSIILADVAVVCFLLQLVLGSHLFFR